LWKVGENPIEPITWPIRVVLRGEAGKQLLQWKMENELNGTFCVRESCKDSWMAALEHENLFSILNLAILMQAIVFNFNAAEQEW